MSDIVRLREEMLRMALGARRHLMADWFIEHGYPRMKRATAAKVAPKRQDREPREIVRDDERILQELRLYNPPKSNVAIGNHLGFDGGRVSETMKAANADGRSITEVLARLNDIRAALDRGDTLPFKRWQRTKRT